MQTGNDRAKLSMFVNQASQPEKLPDLHHLLGTNLLGIARQIDYYYREFSS